MVANESPGDGLRIAQVERLTGVGAHTLRAWERRYGVPVPDRSGGRQRMYSLADVDVIRRMQSLSLQGVALRSAAQQALREAATRGEGVTAAQSNLARLLDALLNFDEARATAIWAEMIEGHDLRRVFEDVVTTVLRYIGDGWHEGRVTVGQEHFATAFVRGRLEVLARQVTPLPGAPAVVLACLEGERHELGLLMLTVLLRFQGLRTIYLGADVPHDALLRTIEDVQPAVAAVHAGTADGVAVLPRLIEAAARTAPQTRVVFGGPVFDANRDLRAFPGATWGSSSLETSVQIISQISRAQGAGGPA